MFENLLETLLENFSSSGAAWAVWGPFLLLVISGIGVPIPEDVSLVLAGILSAQYSINLPFIILMMYLAVFIGDCTMYALGRYYGPTILGSRIGQKLFKPSRVQQVHSAFEKYGSAVVFVGRFMPGLRSPLFLTSGSIKYPFGKFIFWDFAAASFSVPFWVYLGYWVWSKYGEDIELLKEKMNHSQKYFLWGALLLTVLLVVYFKFIKKKQKKGSNEAV